MFSLRFGRGALAAALASATLLTAGCATETTYHPAAGQGFNRTGFSERQIEPNRFIVSFAGNTVTSRDTVERYLLFRAAELTLQQGDDYFVMVDRDTDRQTRTYSTPGIGGYGGFGGGFGYGGFGGGYWGPSWRFHRGGGFGGGYGGGGGYAGGRGGFGGGYAGGGFGGAAAGAFDSGAPAPTSAPNPFTDYATAGGERGDTIYVRNVSADESALLRCLLIDAA